LFFLFQKNKSRSGIGFFILINTILDDPPLTDLFLALFIVLHIAPGVRFDRTNYYGKKPDEYYHRQKY